MWSGMCRRRRRCMMSCREIGVVYGSWGRGMLRGQGEEWVRMGDEKRVRKGVRWRGASEEMGGGSSGGTWRFGEDGEAIYTVQKIE